MANPHAKREAGTRGQAQGRKAREGKPYKANPYNPAFANNLKKSASKVAGVSSANQKSWNERFEIEAGFKFKPFAKPNKHAVKA